MDKFFVDTNYFLRFLLKDLDTHHKKAYKLFERAKKGELKLVSSTINFFEVSWVLKSYYSFSKPKIVSGLETLISLSFLQMQDKEIFIQALGLFGETRLDLEDCFVIASAWEQGCNDIATFDKGLKKVFRKEAL